MKKVFPLMLVLSLSAAAINAQAEEKWSDLIFRGTLMGWRAAENPESFTIEDGVITCQGEQAHLFYLGPIANADFQNFEFMAKVKTEPGAISAVYFHTSYQETGKPKKGFKVQINNSNADVPDKTGSLCKIHNILSTDLKDNQWYDIHIIVKDKTIKVRVNDEKWMELVHFEEPTPPKPPEGYERRILASGTFALQAHSPDSKVYFKDIKVKVLD